MSHNDGQQDDSSKTDRPALTEEDELALALSKGQEELAAGQAQAAADRLEDAVTLARRLGDEVGEAEAGGLLAQAYLRLDLREEAARQASEALEIARARRDEEAARHLEGLLQIAMSSPEETEMSIAFGDGREALLRGDAEQAVTHLERSLKLAKDLGHRVAEGASTQLLAQAYLETGEQDRAETLAEQAKEVSEALGDAEATHRAQQLKEQAEALSQPSCPVEEGIAAELRNGQSALSDGDMERGVSHLERARDLAIEQGEVIPEASASGMLAQAYIELGRREDAIAHATRALAIAEELGHEEAARDFRELLEVASTDPEHLALARELHLGATALAVDDGDNAIVHLEDALNSARKLGETVSEIMAAGLLARAYVGRRRHDEAAQLARSALELIKKRGDTKAERHFVELLAEIESVPEATGD